MFSTNSTGLKSQVFIIFLQLPIKYFLIVFNIFLCENF